MGNVNIMLLDIYLGSITGQAWFTLSVGNIMANMVGGCIGSTMANMRGFCIFSATSKLSI